MEQADKMADTGGGSGKGEAYNQFQRAYFEGRTKKTMVPREDRYLRRHVQEALSFGGIEAGARVAEVGCGMGRYTLLLAKRGLRVTGLDLSPVLLERLREYNVENLGLDVQCADIEDPPADLAGAFDAVVGFFVLHHLFDLDKGIRGIARLLRPGGRAVFVEPNPLNPLYYLQIAFTPGMHWKAERGILQMRPEVVRERMAGAGLRDFEFRRFGFFPPVLANRAAGARLEGWIERVPLLEPIRPFQLFRGELPGVASTGDVAPLRRGASLPGGSSA